MTSGFNPVTTPYPSVHRAAPSAIQPFSAAQTQAFGEAIVDEILAQVAFAIANVDVLGMKPFAFLQQYGQELEAKAQDALATAEGAQTTAGDAQTAATDAQTAAAKASEDLTTLINDGLAGLGLSQTGSGADFGNALQAFVGDLFGSGAVVGTSTSNIQHSALPATYGNVHQDLQTLFNDVVFADGRSWADIGPDVQQLVDDLVGEGQTVTVTAPAQIPPAAIASVGTAPSLAADVTAAATASTITGGGTVQDVVDMIHQAINGGSATGNDVSTVKANLQQIPQPNIAIIDASGSTEVTLLHAGVGKFITGPSDLTLQWTDTIPVGTNFLLIVANHASTHTTFASCYVTDSFGYHVVSAVYDSDYSGSAAAAMFGMFNPPTGAVTFQVVVDDSSSLASMIAATALCFSGVGSVSSVLESGGQAQQPSLTTPFTTKQLVVNSINTFAVSNTNVNLSGYNQTSEYHAGFFSTGQFGMDLLVGIAQQVASPTFSAQVPFAISSEAVSSLAVGLNPQSTSAVVGSYVYIHGVSSSVTLAAGDQVLPNNTFDTIVKQSADIAVVLLNGSFQVTYSGAYSFKFGVSPDTLTAQRFHGICYVNGALYSRAGGGYFTQFGEDAVSFGFDVYLDAGDIVQPGMNWQDAGVALNGAADLGMLWASLSLMNRSYL